ncbi:MAG: hydroxyisourate hydrolase [Ectothiorhodospiraceae bacterium]
MGYLTTHVLDTAQGTPGAGMAIDLYRLAERGRVHLHGLTANDDGRADGPLLQGEAFTAGHYELVFQVGAYFRARGVALPEPAFLEDVVVRFGIASPDTHYHVPLLVSPYGYSTYRGS